MGVAMVRVLLGGLGALFILGGIAVAAVAPTDGGGLFAGLWLFVPGAVLIAAVLLERTRYRSLEAERTGSEHGPGGGEPAPVEPRFRRTEETFVDPTSGTTMRVFSDPLTGERRYVAEG